MSEWDTKLEAIAESTIDRDITNLSGVPSWFLVLIKHILKKTGRQNLTEVWPNLEVFFHGGISFAPYREQYRELISNPDMHYVETYNASEGFFAVQNDLSVAEMLLLIDLGIFYEFIPLGKSNEHAVPLWEVEAGRNYEMVITSNGGPMEISHGRHRKNTLHESVKDKHIGTHQTLYQCLRRRTHGR